MATDGVDFVDKDDARSVLLGLLEHVTDAARTDTNKHFDKVGTGNGEERHLGLSGDCFGQQGFTSSWRSI